MLSFAINHLLSDGFNAFELKFTNLLIHLLCGVIVFLITKELLKISIDKDKANFAAVVVVSLWLLSPLNTHLNFYVVQRMTQLSCFFILLGIFTYIKARLTMTSTRWKAALFMVCALCWPLSFFAKETGILLPAYLLVIETYFISPLHKTKYLRLATAVMVLFGLAASVAAVTFNVFDYSNRPFTVYERIYTQPSVIVDYLRELILPTRADVGVFQDDYGVQNTFKTLSFFSSATIITLLIIISTIGPLRTSLRPVWGGLMLFFIAHSIESTIVPLEMYFQHRNYFPSVGLYIALVGGAFALFKIAFLRSIMILLGCISFVLSVYFSSQAAAAWASYPQFVANAYTHHPTSTRASSAMVELLTQSGQFDAALRINEMATAANPNNNLFLTAQRFYVFCKAQITPNNSEYEKFHGEIKPLNFLELSTALDNLFFLELSKHCSSVDFAKLSKNLATISEQAINSKSLTPKQAWNIEYYLIDYYRRNGDEASARRRLDKLTNLGNDKAAIYREEFKL